MKMEIVPVICQGEDATYTGKIVVEVPKAPERHNYIRQAGLMAVMENAGDKSDAELAVGLSSQHEMMTKLMGFVEKHLVSVDLVRKDDGRKVDKVEEFMSISSCEPAVMEICKLFLKGFEPGKNSGA